MHESEPQSSTTSTPAVVCAACGREACESDTFLLAEARYCAACKPQILQRIAAGEPAASSSREAAYRMIHRFAIVSLLFVAVKGVYGNVLLAAGAHGPMRFEPLFGVAIWSFLLWKLWKQPRKWGLRVGVLLFLMIPFQSYLWWVGTHAPRPDVVLIDDNWSLAHFILVHELPIFIAAASCTLLRFSARGLIV